jgi:DNA polymerase-3 subunit epsilon
MTSTALLDLEYLVLDCQATGAAGSGGRLLEIGWMTTGAAASPSGHLPAARVYTIRPDSPVDLPPRVAQFTGISKRELAAGGTTAAVWRKLGIAAGNIAAALPVARCPTVIHYARFEAPFLHALHQENTPAADFPLEIICSHEIARRLFPTLSRRGLRALAGYLGLSVQSQRRCRPHLVATAFIWHHLVGRLRTGPGITTLRALHDWLQTRPAPRNANRTYPMQTSQHRTLTRKPGVYEMCRQNGSVLYLCKAASLQRRVSSYFAPRTKHSDHILEMLSQARRIIVRPTESALEAALLETDEIKRLAPPYNIALQVGRRELWYYSRDFKKASLGGDTHHPIGPLTGPQPGATLAALARLLQNPGRLSDADEALWYELTGRSGQTCPDPDELREGLRLFRQNHLPSTGPGSLPRTLLGIGARLWRRRQDTDPEGQETDCPTKTEPDEPVWTPDTVTACLESAVRYGTWQIRRARWLTLLTRCTLAWAASASGDNECRRVLIIRKGSVAHRDWLHHASTPPAPRSGDGHRATGAREWFDLAALDRMRVLSTEIRRLCIGDRRVQLRLGPRFILTRRQLEKMFDWI